MPAPTIAITSTTNGALPYGYLSIGDTARPFGENPVLTPDCGPAALSGPHLMIRF
jgi:hypothetical protein